MRYFDSPGGTSIGVDPIGLLRGAPHPELARAFIDYILETDGQKLWDFKVGAPGGPEKYALRRLPIRPQLYASEYAPYRSDPNVFPYEEAKSFTYHPEWTGSLFGPLRFVVRVMCVDPHEEAREALAALIRAGFPPEASRTFADVSGVSYDMAKTRISEVLRSGDKLGETRLAAEFAARFRAQYQRAAELARAGR
jgi:spermidine/putrescine-binding protein